MQDYHKNYEVLTIGQILDQSLRLLPKAFYHLLWFCLPIVICELCTLFSDKLFPPSEQLFLSIGVVFLASCLEIILTFCVYYLGTFVCADLWLGRETHLYAAFSKASFTHLLRLLALMCRITFIGMLGLLLFLIPGMVYFLNRTLAPIILILNNSSVSDSIRESKRLMTSESWYRLSGPMMRISAIILLTMILSMLPVGLHLGSEYMQSKSLDLFFVAFVQFIALMFTQFLRVFGYLSYVGFYYDLRARYEGADLLDRL